MPIDFSPIDFLKIALLQWEAMKFLGLGSIAVLTAQSFAQAPVPAFEAASLRLTHAQFASGVKTDPGRLTVTGVGLGDLIRLAYGVSALQVSGVPAGLGRFDVEATAAGAHTRAELLEMLQAMLADRFKLTLHRETQELPVQALVSGKNGTKFEKAAEDVDPNIALRSDPSGAAVAAIEYAGENVTLGFVANYVSDRLHEVVVDRSGLGGRYDFRITVDLDRARATDPSVPEREVAAELYIGFVEKLGLRLERQKAPVEVLVVDHAETPGEN